MARVTVIGAGIAGLTTALYATTAGHHVVVLDRTDTLGGRATSQTIAGVPLGYGLHLLNKKGPLAKTVKKISRLPLVHSSPRLDRLNVVGVGPLRPRNNVRLAAEIRRALRTRDNASLAYRGATLLAGSGTPHDEKRLKALQKGHLSLIGEGWAGVVGRMAAALDEVGVLIEPHCTVETVNKGQVSLKDGRTFESDVVVVACGLSAAKRLLSSAEGQVLSTVQPVKASTVDAVLDSKPLGNLHGLIDVNEGAYVVDAANLQPRWPHNGAVLSALMAGRENEDGEARLERLMAFLDEHATGWQRHVVHVRKQSNITVQTKGKKPRFDAYASEGILLAGEWVESPHALADAAADTGRLCGQNISAGLA